MMLTAEEGLSVAGDEVADEVADRLAGPIDAIPYETRFGRLPMYTITCPTLVETFQLARTRPLT
jgi:hypothetical protein